ncbi:hypothetical protein GCM10020220_115150 [Nonomuraea rubra]
MAAGWSIVQCGLHVPPGSISWCGPPSIFAGSRMPCQCTVLASASRLVTVMRTRSPRAARIVGPRYGPLNPQVSTGLPGRSSLRPRCIVRAKCRVPFRSTSGFRSGGTRSSVRKAAGSAVAGRSPGPQAVVEARPESAAMARNCRRFMIPG